MWNFLKTRGVDLAIATIGLTALMPGPAWATIVPGLPGPAAGLRAGAAIIGAIVVAKWWRRN